MCCAPQRAIIWLFNICKFKMIPSDWINELNICNNKFTSLKNLFWGLKTLVSRNTYNKLLFHFCKLFLCCSCAILCAYKVNHYKNNNFLCFLMWFVITPPTPFFLLKSIKSLQFGSMIEFSLLNHNTKFKNNKDNYRQNCKDS